MALSHSTHAWCLCLAATGAIVCLTAGPIHAQQAFQSPDAAAGALVAAVKSGARQDVVKVLGKTGEDIIGSGDEVADAAGRERFVKLYDDKHSISQEGEGKATLILGAEDFPFPIPLTKKSAGWEFDAAAGRIEILQRRIGRNELDAIQTCLAYVDAQNEYADKDRTGAGPGVYAGRIVSSPGKKDGLYWPSGTDDSPLGELAAQASAEGYRAGSEPRPYHGYYYRILTRQGPNAPGGELDYVVRGKMIGGFALVAYPAEYGNSGVMTFVVNHAGAVYQKDLGPRTAELARRMTAFDPDRTWSKVDASSK
ncbi:MAG: DUF2950 domain-containing protein [Bradyrhizobium sp.]|uniref:DUF2950 domain-containing protein n=1 Tax=Bradyrhizobium sp. TaxID=376 RepID=UPI0025C07B13|nr:DUF2950 domain-containing protein [Bradyrhizobium sp.]MBI5260665.1 DUF2950 domain-containing protein [Bradyrhizobium sp.]